MRIILECVWFSYICPDFCGPLKIGTALPGWRQIFVVTCLPNIIVTVLSENKELFVCCEGRYKTL